MAGPLGRDNNANRTHLPRPKPKKGPPTGRVGGHILSDDAKVKLLECLGFDCQPKKTAKPLFDAELWVGGLSDNEKKEMLDRLRFDCLPKKAAKALSDVELWLGAYPSAVEAMNNSPRAADYREALTPIHRRASDLVNNLKNLNQWMRDALEIRGADMTTLEPALKALVAAAGVAAREHSGKESRGRPKNMALDATIQQLQRIFRDHYEGSRDSRRRRGAFEYLAGWEKREREFVETALRDAAIIAEGYVDLPRLFRDPRSVPQEKKVARDAKKARPAR